MFLEANASGKPVVGIRSGGVEDAVVEGVTGLLVEPDNREQLITVISRLIENKELREELGRRGKERAFKELAWDNGAAKMVSDLQGGEEQVRMTST